MDPNKKLEAFERLINRLFFDKLPNVKKITVSVSKRPKAYDVTFYGESKRWTIRERIAIEGEIRLIYNMMGEKNEGELILVHFVDEDELRDY